MAEDALERRMEELRLLGLSEQQIVDLVHRELQRAQTAGRGVPPADGDMNAREDGKEVTPSPNGGEADAVVPTDSGAPGHPLDPDVLLHEERPDAILRERLQGATRAETLMFRRRQSGPLPPADVAQQYQALYPAYMAEEMALRKADSARKDRELTIVETAVRYEHERTTRGQDRAFLTVMATLVLACIALFFNPYVAGGIAAADVVGITVAFIKG